jgi:hypothetical protein
VVLQRHWGAEHRHDPVAGELVHRAVVALHHFLRAAEQLGHDFAQPLRADRGRDVHRVHHVGEQDGDLLVYSRSSGLCEWRAALVTELGVRCQFGAARPTQQPRRGQSTATIPAGVHVGIISPLVNDRAAHHWSQAKLKTQAGFFQRLHWPAGSAPRFAFSQLAILVRSAVPSSNFPQGPPDQWNTARSNTAGYQLTTLCSLMHCTAAHFASRYLPIITLLRDGHWPSAFQAPPKGAHMSVMMHQMNRAPGTVSGVDDPAGLSHGLASRATPPPGTDAGRDMGRRRQSAAGQRPSSSP